MHKLKIIGTLLIIISLLMIIGFMLHSNLYWYIVDAFVIIVSGISGVLLIKMKPE